MSDNLDDVNGRDVKKAKGVNRNVFSGRRHKEFVKILFSRGEMKHRMNRIQSKLYKIETYDVRFICLVLMIKDTY